MRLFDFWLQLVTLIIFVIVSPLIFANLSSTNEDLIWIWVIVVTSITSFVSLIVISILNFFVAPEKTYKIKGLLPLALSSFLAYHIGNGVDSDMEVPFLLGNLFLLIMLYIVYGLVFINRMKSRKNQEK